VTLRFTGQATQEIAAARSYYEERQAGLGLRFDGAMDAATKAIARSPEMYRASWKDRRRVPLKGFSYFLVYFVNGDTVVVTGCFHTSRNPATWKKRGVE